MWSNSCMLAQICPARALERKIVVRPVSTPLKPLSTIVFLIVVLCVGIPFAVVAQDAGIENREFDRDDGFSPV
jgi:hypothetical protein